MSYKIAPGLAFILLDLTLALVWTPFSHASERFTRLNEDGKPIAGNITTKSREWPCVLDKKTGLIWEVKSRNLGLHNLSNTFSWFNPDTLNNGGLAGYPGGGNCRSLPCDTSSFLDEVNRIGWCNGHDWRLPTREELRSLVNYEQQGNRPVLDSSAFPNTAATFYWSADPSATNPEEAWGVGFTFGFDYAYFKQNRAQVRLVRAQKFHTNYGGLK